MAGSIDRVTAAAAEAGLDIQVRRMGGSTRTAEEAAAQCGCSVAQIVKSLVFSGEESGRLYLFLLPGTRRLDAGKASAVTGESLARAEPRQVRELTGFAIGGVAPIGHLVAIPTYARPGVSGPDPDASGPRRAPTTRYLRPNPLR